MMVQRAARLEAGVRVWSSSSKLFDFVSIWPNVAPKVENPLCHVPKREELDAEQQNQNVIAS